MDIKEDIKKLDKKIKEISMKQQKKQDEIEKLKKDKVTLREDFYKNYSKKSKYFDEIRDDVEKYVTGDTSLSELNREIQKLYHIAFNGIIGGRVKTNIKFPSYVSKWNSEDEIWINCKGIAYKPKELRSWVTTETRTKCLWDWEEISKLIIDYPNLKRYIKRKDKKKIFTHFRDCLVGWKHIKIKEISHPQVIYIPTFNKSWASTGYTGCSIQEKDKIIIKLNELSRIRLQFKKGNVDYDSYIIGLDKHMDLQQEYILNQLSKDTIGEMKKLIEEVKDVYEHNKKLLDKLKYDISPYIIHRLI